MMKREYPPHQHIYKDYTRCCEIMIDLIQAINSIPEGSRIEQCIILGIDILSSTDAIVNSIASRYMTAPIHIDLVNALFDMYTTSTSSYEDLDQLPTPILVMLTYVSGRNHKGDVSRGNMLSLLLSNEPIIYQLLSGGLLVDEYILK